MAATVGVEEGGRVDEVAEQVGDLGLQDVVAWGCGLCQGHLPAAAAATIVAIAGTVVGRAGTVAVAVVVAAVAAAVAFAVAVVASDPVGPLRSGSTFSFLPSRFGYAHEDHISYLETGSSLTHCGPDGDGKHNTLFGPLPYSNLPSQEGV
ncbi:hypothetical protein Taro_046719 [Colocasia esculenta]|uniref:Uncharacterized protein n=1 Tax=Colocasia esculenta TaxID=4460 RepID=A0A843X6H1_COLES|nr:hypothetical protein [Colocasia esculenta]